MWRFRTFSEAWPHLSSVCLSRLWGPAHTKPRLIFPPYPTSPDTGSRPRCPPPPPPPPLPLAAFSGRDRLPSLIQVRCLSSCSLSRLSKHLSHGFFPWGGSSRRNVNMFSLIPPHCSLTSVRCYYQSGCKALRLLLTRFTGDRLNGSALVYMPPSEHIQWLLMVFHKYVNCNE